ncbi:hypothetical protein T492DRAFT_524647 [Pavlovales sp. CCMP2436]|nr:hypothetical protein T492DRAFT_524647 [Pavlovales sp. CCMP2436]
MFVVPLIPVCFIPGMFVVPLAEAVAGSPGGVAGSPGGVAESPGGVARSPGGVARSPGGVAGSDIPGSDIAGSDIPGSYIAGSDIESREQLRVEGQLEAAEAGATREGESDKTSDAKDAAEGSASAGFNIASAEAVAGSNITSAPAAIPPSLRGVVALLDELEAQIANVPPAQQAMRYGNTVSTLFLSADGRGGGDKLR